MLINGERIEATFANILFLDDKLWFTEWNCNELFYYDLKKREVVFFCKFYDEKEYGVYLFGRIIPYKDYLFIIPASATSLYKVNIKNREIRRISLDSLEIYKTENRAKFLSAHIVRGKLYLIGAACPLIVELDCETGDSPEVVGVIDFVKQESNATIYVRNSLLIDEKIYMPICQKNFVGIFDIKERKIIYKQVGSNNYGYSAICGKNGKQFWLTPRNKGFIVYWEIETGFWKEIEFPVNYELPQNSFSDCVIWKDDAWIFPLNAKGIWKVNCDNNHLSICNGIAEKANMIRVCCSTAYLFFFSQKENRLYIVDDKNNIVDSISIFLPEDNARYHKNNNFAAKIILETFKNGEVDNQLFIEMGEIMRLDYYLLWLKNRKEIDTGRSNAQKKGQVIFTILKKEEVWQR